MTILDLENMNIFFWNGYGQPQLEERLRNMLGHRQIPHKASLNFLPFRMTFSEPGSICKRSITFFAEGKLITYHAFGMFEFNSA